MEDDVKGGQISLHSSDENLEPLSPSERTDRVEEARFVRWKI